MSPSARGLISFFAGGIVGAGVAIFLLKNKFESIYREQAEEMHRVYQESLVEAAGYKTETKGGEGEPAELAKLNREKPDINAFAKDIAEGHKFVDYAAISKGEKLVKDVIGKEEEEEVPDDIQYIDPEFFGEYADYGQTFLTYYSDRILAHDEEILDENDISDTVGIDYEEHFGDYEDDAVHVRNDITKQYYEILADNRTFERAIKDKRLQD